MSPIHRFRRPVFALKRSGHQLLTMLTPISAHEAESGFVWWDEALLFAVSIVLGILGVMLIARRSRADDIEDA